MGETVLAKLAIQIAANTAGFATSLNTANSQFSKFTSNLASTAKGLIAGFGLVEIGKQMIDVTSEFQKFEAILTNTLGSNSQAQKALSDIRNFSLTTPFEVAEVTAAYVRWANQGLSPTIDRLRKIGDVASALGAGFEQTAEAFKDLAVGQTKRLEEIGISATQANGKIQLSFKGVNIEIEKNVGGVQQALDVYSQLNGVLGTTEAVSNTLGGRISNLKDAWSNLLLVIGNGTGVLGQSVDALTHIVNMLSHFSNETEIDKVVFGFKNFRDLTKETLDYIIRFDKEISGVFKPFDKLSNQDFASNFDDNAEKIKKALTDIGATTEQAATLLARYTQIRIESLKADRDAEKSARLTEIIKANSDAQADYNLRLAAYKNYLEAINKLKGIAAGTKTTLFDVNYTPEFERPGDVFSAEEMDNINNEFFVPFKKAWEEAHGVVNGAFMNMEKSVDKFAKGLIDFTPVIFTALAGIGQALGSAFNGTANFGQSLLKVLGGVLVQLGEMLVAAGLGVEAFKASLESLNGVAAVAAGIALIAIGTAVSGSIKGLGRSAGRGTGSVSSRGGSSFSGPSFSGNTQNTQDSLSLVGVIRGQDLYVTIENYKRNGGRLKG